MSSDWQKFFIENESPKNLDAIVLQVDEFCQKFKDERKIVLVTSGGTTIPFERNTVRLKILMIAFAMVISNGSYLVAIIPFEKNTVRLKMRLETILKCH